MTHLPREPHPSARHPLPDGANALAVCLALLLALVPVSTRAADTLTITEDFSSTTGRDATTTARWSPEEQALVLAFRRSRYGAFGPGTTNGTAVTNTIRRTEAVALGDVDGDGDLDLVAGNELNSRSRLYLNNGTADPFAGVTGSDITTDAHPTVAVALGDVDGDGDLDLVAGNLGRNRLYLNNGTADPFAGVSGSDVTTDNQATRAVALGDVDGDGDLDLVAGDISQPNRLYLNNGTADPFAGVTGADVTADTQNTWAIALGDVDGDGDLDLLAGNANQPNRLYLNNGTADPFAAVTGSDVTADAHSTRAVALGDVDGDGDLDLVAGNDGQRNRLYLNNGTADPFVGVTGSAVTTDAQETFAVALGDVDGDGDLDLVVGNSSFQRNSLYLNNGTTDPFAGVTGADITTDAQNTSAVALGDVDGDGDLDLVAGNFVQANRLYLNNGTTNPFSGLTGSDATADAQNTLAVALGDVDGDGDLDLVAGNSGPNRLYLNNGTADPFSGVTGTDVTTDAQATRAVALGDLDGDGDLDLVVGNSFDQPNRLYLNNGTADPFSGVTGSDVTADGHITEAVALGDLDGDGDLDLVVGNSFGQPNRLYLNNGTADPFSGVTGSDVTADAENTRAVALGDVDRDGDLDLVVGNFNQPNRLYLNNGTADPFSGVTGSDVTADAQITEAVALGDVDRDGDLDLVVGNAFNQPNRLYLNNGTADPFSGVIGSDVTTDTQDTFAVALGDVDGDGDLDLVAGNFGQSNRLYLNNGTAAPFFGVTGSDVATDAQITEAVALGDLDGDGGLDLVVGNFNQPNRLYLNDGTAAPFAGVTGADVTADALETLAVALGDVDRDGDLDLVVGNDGQPNRLYLNNGTADPFAGVTGADVTADAEATLAVALGDVDGDGDLDLVVGNDGQPNRLYLNNGTAEPFAGITGSDVTIDAEATRALALGDVDRDGDLDLVVGNFSQRNRLYLNNGTADPFAGVTGSDVTVDAQITEAVALGDVDGDGDLDLVVGNSFNQHNRLYLNNGTADPFAGVTSSDVTTDAQITLAVALGDVDGDGDLDLVVGNSNFQRNRLYLNNGTAAPFAGVTGSDVTDDTQSTGAIALGDVDGDGDLDLVAGNDGEPNRLYLNNGTADPFAGVVGTDVTTDAQDTRAVALGAVDGDGRLDLVEGNSGQPNRLYLTRLHDTARGVAASTDLGPELRRVARVTLSADTNLPPNTAVDWLVTANGGDRWLLARPGVALDLPASAQGTGLRWRAELTSLSPARTPRVESLTLLVEFDTDGDGLLDSVDDDDDDDGVADSADAFPTDPAASVDTDGDGQPDDYNAGATPEQRAASPLVIDLDDDGDGVADTADNCPLDRNATQRDRDGDGIGDACDPRDDSETCFPIPAGSGRLAMVCL